MCFVCFFKTNGQEDYPILKEIVTDKANLFTNNELLQLQQKLTTYESETTHQIVVLTINDLGNDTVENYAYRVFNKNKLGQKEADNGLLILIAKNNRKFRIEVGDGLTPIITDAFASRIIRNIMTPEFKDGDFYKGVDSGTSEVIKLIDDPKYRDEFTNLIEEDGKIPLWGKILLMLCIGLFVSIFVGVGGMLFIKGYKQLINLYIGLITGKVSVLMFPLLLIQTVIMMAFSLPFLLMPLALFIGVFLQFVLGYDIEVIGKSIIDSGYINLTNVIILIVSAFIISPIIISFLTRSKKRYQPIKLSLAKSNKSYMSKHFSSGGVSSGSSSYSSSSSSSSFSGGGGSSSGGGASGSW